MEDYCFRDCKLLSSIIGLDHVIEQGEGILDGCILFRLTTTVTTVTTIENELREGNLSQESTTMIFEGLKTLGSWGLSQFLKK